MLKKQELIEIGMTEGTVVMMKKGLVVSESHAPGVIEKIEWNDETGHDIFIKFSPGFAEKFGRDTFEYEIREGTTLQDVKDELGIGVLDAKKTVKAEKATYKERMLRILNERLDEASTDEEKKALEEKIKFYTLNLKGEKTMEVKAGDSTLKYTSPLDKNKNRVRIWFAVLEIINNNPGIRRRQIHEAIINNKKRYGWSMGEHGVAFNDAMTSLRKDGFIMNTNEGTGVKESSYKLTNSGVRMYNETKGKISVEDDKILNSSKIVAKGIRLLFKEENFATIKDAIQDLTKDDFRNVSNKREILKELADTKNIEELNKWIKDYYDATEQLLEEEQAMLDEAEEVAEEVAKEAKKEPLAKTSTDVLPEPIEESPMEQSERIDKEIAEEPVLDPTTEDLEMVLNSLHDKAIDKYVQYNNESTEDKFYASKEFNEFKIEAMELCMTRLLANKITDKEIDAMLDIFNIKPSTEELNAVMAKIDVPKPSSPPPQGMKYMWDADSKVWVLVKASIEANDEDEDEDEDEEHNVKGSIKSNKLSKLNLDRMNLVDDITELENTTNRTPEQTKKLKEMGKELDRIDEEIDKLDSSIKADDKPGDGYVGLVFDIDAGSGHSLDYYYNPNEKFIREIKTNPDGKEIRNEIEAEEFLRGDDSIVNKVADVLIDKGFLDMSGNLKASIEASDHYLTQVYFKHKENGKEKVDQVWVRTVDTTKETVESAAKKKAAQLFEGEIYDLHANPSIKAELARIKKEDDPDSFDKYNEALNDESDAKMRLEKGEISQEEFDEEIKRIEANDFESIKKKLIEKEKKFLSTLNDINPESGEASLEELEKVTTIEGLKTWAKAYYNSTVDELINENI